jgi:hypothetical protein
MQNHFPEHYPLKEKKNAQGSDLAPLFGDLSPSEKLFKIKLLLAEWMLTF